MDDSLIVDLYWQRNESAIRESQKKYGKQCQQLAYSITHDRLDAEECVNDTWLRAWNAIPPARPTLLGSFLYKITRNLSLDRVRTALTDRHSGDSALVPLEELRECLPDTGGEPSDSGEISAAISAFLRTETTENRRVFVCRYFYHDSIRDIASRMGMREGAVKTCLSRTRAKLRDYLEKEGIDV